MNIFYWCRERRYTTFIKRKKEGRSGKMQKIKLVRIVYCRFRGHCKDGQFTNQGKDFDTVEPCDKYPDKCKDGKLKTEYFGKGIPAEFKGNSQYEGNG
jgi:hypothetical protein